jgi:crotonobetainyl-CoA:carnitine CoA-transferase CaiB-like acyl-CoA transferase
MFTVMNIARPAADAACNRLPLDGVSVVDLTMNISGPYATMILGDLGAEVMKVERPDGGDDTRRWAPVDRDGSAYFYSVNRNKRSVTLDLRDGPGRARLRAMIAEADVFVTNMRARKLAALGLDYDSLHEIHPRLVYADISGYGNLGPDADRPGYDMVLQARSGLMSVTGEAGRPPVRVGVSILDMGSGLWLALGVLAALWTRDRTNEGCRVSTSLLEVGAAFMAYDIAVFELSGAIARPRGSNHPAFAPYGLFQAEDSYVAIGGGGDHLFARLAEALGRRDWAEDPRFATNSARVANQDDLRSEIEAELQHRPAADWIRLLSAAGVPADEVSNAARILGDEQLRSLDYWVDVPLPNAAGEDRRSLRQPGLPIRLSQVRPPVRYGPPAIEQPGTAGGDAV